MLMQKYPVSAIPFLEKLEDISQALDRHAAIRNSGIDLHGVVIAIEDYFACVSGIINGQK